MYVAKLADHSYLPELIDRNGVVCDVGVNYGAFSRGIADACGRVIGVEPDPRLLTRLELPENVHVFAGVLAAHEGTHTLNLNQTMCPSLHFSDGAARIEVEARTLSQLIGDEPRIELLKLDIEGEEIPVLLEAPAELLRRIVQVTVEFHEFLDPASVPQIRRVIRRMESLGFYVFSFSARTHGDVLFVNSDFARLPLFVRLWMVARYKYVRGVGRIVSRRLDR